MKMEPRTVSEVYSDNIQLRDKEAKPIAVEEGCSNKVFPKHKVHWEHQKVSNGDEYSEGTSKGIGNVEQELQRHR